MTGGYEIPLTRLKPHYVELTDHVGVLRCLRPGESMKRARGLTFECPRCKPKGKQKEHCLVFLFDMDEVPKAAKPLGRFSPSMERWDDGDGEVYLAPSPFERLSLQEMDREFEADYMFLVPRDMKCGWTGTLEKGIVRWKPTWWERRLS